MPPRAIIHVDMDAFFAAVEMLDHPELRGKPLIVGGTPEGRGVVAAASYEVRRYGVHSAMSAWRARRLCPHAVFVRPRMARYVEVSRRIRAIFEAYTPLVEPLSLDEAFLDVTGSRRLFGPAEAIGHAIKARIREETGLTASVGVAPNKFLSKLGSDLRKPDGFVVVEPGAERAFLDPLPVGKLWGVGKRARERLNQLGIETVHDLRAYTAAELEGAVGSFARRLLEMADGIDETPVVAGGVHKSISEESTFAHDIDDEEELRGHLLRQAERVARRMRANGLRTRTVQIKARYADFETVTRALSLPAPTAATATIQRTAIELLARRLGRRGRPLRLLGVGVSNLEPADAGQLELFAEEESGRWSRLDEVVDALQLKHGDASVVRGLGVRGEHRDRPDKKR